MSTHLLAPASIQFEATLQRTVLRRCPDCESPHPYALKLKTLECPGCGLERDGGQTETVPAVITGATPAMQAGKLFLGIGRWIANLATRT